MERINQHDGTRNNAHRGHWGRSVGTARLRLRMDKPLRMSARTLLAVALVAGALVLAGPDAHSLIAGAEPETTPPVNESQSDQDLTTTLDRSGRVVAHRLQLGHRAGARRPQPAAHARHRQPALHGHRRDRQSGDGAFPIAHRTVAGERARAELRIRPARSGQAAAQVRRPRGHADAQPPGRRHDAAGRSEGAAPQLQHQPGVEDRQRDRHRDSAPITSAFPSCPTRSTHGRR